MYISLYYFINYTFIGLAITYGPEFYKASGFNSIWIALLVGVQNLGIITINPWLHKLLYSGVSRKKLFDINSAILGLLGAILLVYPTLPLIFFLSILSSTGAYALLETSTIELSERQGLIFSKIRLWGSWGFIFGSFGIAFIPVEHFPIYLGSFAILTAILLKLSSTISLSSLDDVIKITKTSYEKFTIKKELIPIYVGTFLSWLAHSPLYVLLSLYYLALGGSKFYISCAWALGVLAEIGIFYLWPHLLKRFNPYHLFIFSLTVTGIRFILMSMISNVQMLVSLQILHAITFGITYLAAVEIVNRSCEPEFRQKAQSNLLAFGLGTGSFIGRTICGLLVGSLVTVASYQYVFMTSGIICLVGVIVLVRNHSKYSEIL